MLEDKAHMPGTQSRTPVLTCPAKVTVPELGVSKPASKPNSVLLPEPEAPTIAKLSPAATLKLMSCKICNGAPAKLTLLLRFIALKMGVGAVFKGIL